MSSAKGKHLVVVESPSKAKTISRFLGNEYRVEASFGHVRDLPESAKEIPAKLKKSEWARLGVDVDNGFEPIYVVPKNKERHIKTLKSAIDGAEELLLATDEDREGESIGWHVLEVLKPKSGLPIRRIVFHEVTREAIQEALKSPRDLDLSLVRAQEARRILDRLYGYKLSELLWKRVSKGLSAGRVQSVAVRLCVERERDRIAFVSSTYWDIEADLKAKGGDFTVKLTKVGGKRIADGKSFDPLTGKLKDKSKVLIDEIQANALADAAKGSGNWKVSSLETDPETRKPAPPFTTSTLQQEANRKLKFPSRKTMQIAQQLYEGVDLDGERVGLITYMRTDSVSLASRAVAEAREMIERMYGKEFLPKAPIHYKTKSKGAQEAHEAIRPTDVRRLPQDIKKHLTDDQLKLYELIWKRMVACQMLPANFERTSVEVETKAQEEVLTFSASGRRIVFPGFLRAYVEGSDDPEAELGDKETILPALQVGEPLDLGAIRAEGHSTKPPLRYTEASLVKRLEEEGIGRPSTYATIISTIQDRGYVFKKGNELVPTFTAFCVTQFLEENFPDLVDIAFTARLENELDEIAEGKAQMVEVLSEFYFGDDDRRGLAERINEVTGSYPSVPIGEGIVVKVGRYGPYVQLGEGGTDNIASLPNNFPPDELTPEVALKLIERKAMGGEAVGVDRESGREIKVLNGRYGAYIEIAQTDEEKAAGVKPKRVSLPKGLAPEDVTAEIAAKLASLPRTVGKHPEDGEDIIAGLGRFGPFVKHGAEYRSLPNWEKACDIGVEEAVKLLAQPKPGRGGKGGRPTATVLKDFGELEGAVGPVRILSGRYGPYVTDGKTNASLPPEDKDNPGNVTAEHAMQLLAAKRK
ncbi:MAG: type I DNA topoisomerase [Fimbriimonadales bacterium]|nr:type I DNA topoisomerase [Fimbriimonadales bacterium]